VIGVREEERREKHDIIINVALTLDLRKPGRTDNIEDAIDYSQMKKRIVEMVQASQYSLIEALAEHVAEICLEDPAVKQVQVRVEKPGALRFARSVAVEITRDRQ
jgi:FolB domain-containing protein